MIRKNKIRERTITLKTIDVFLTSSGLPKNVKTVISIHNTTIITNNMIIEKINKAKDSIA